MDDRVDAFLAALDYPMFVVTAACPDTGEPAGCLVGFVTQCSIEPVRLLVCLSKANHTYRIACRARLLAVHSLGPEEADLAELFGTRSGDRVDKFARCAWRSGPDGVPLLDRCGYRLIGRVLERLELGDHDGFLLEPVHAQEAGPNRPLLMFSAVRDLPAGHPA
jgi:flavin reductase (DIM6/NTAB) family NADH-FMN oxidoreductase RutF